MFFQNLIAFFASPIVFAPPRNAITPPSAAGTIMPEVANVTVSNAPKPKVANPKADFAAKVEKLTRSIRSFFLRGKKFV